MGRLILIAWILFLIADLRKNAAYLFLCVKYIHQTSDQNIWQSFPKSV